QTGPFVGLALQGLVERPAKCAAVPHQAHPLQEERIFIERCAMSQKYDAYDADRPLMLRCACGQNHAPGEHDAATAAANTEELSAQFVEATLVKALFPVDAVRRSFLKAVGANTARAAIASMLPLGAL